MATKHPYRIAVVTWLDAVTHSEGEAAPLHYPHTQVSVGWLLKDDKFGISIASEYGREGGWREETFIPRQIIKCVEYLTKR